MLILTGCQTNNPNLIASQANLHKNLHHTSNFIITSYAVNKTNLDPNKPLFIYIEGDGCAWVSKYRLSNNPTPRDPLTLKLAALDPNHNIIYIARPCQFTPLNLDKNCESKYWSQARYSLPVVQSINQVIDNFKLTKQQPVHLIGYSGGATIAGIIASQRSDIASIRTIAGNLDHDAVSEFHQTTKLDESLNLIDFTKDINHIPQIHYIGRNDQIIPAYVIEKFTDKINQQHNKLNCSSHTVFNNLDHYHGWEQAWQNLVTQIPSCAAK